MTKSVNFKLKNKVNYNNKVNEFREDSIQKDIT